MINVHTAMEKGKLIIVVDLAQRHGPSKSGKTTVIATTGGNVMVDANSGATMGLNVYTKQAPADAPAK